jgi:hypothetical protein
VFFVAFHDHGLQKGKKDDFLATDNCWIPLAAGRLAASLIVRPSCLRAARKQVGH